MTCSEEPSPRTRGHKDLKSRSGSPCRPLIAASFRSISRLFPRESFTSLARLVIIEKRSQFSSESPWPVLLSRHLSLPGINQRNQPFPFYYLTGFLSPSEKNIFAEIFSGEKEKEKKRKKIFKASKNCRVFEHLFISFTNWMNISLHACMKNNIHAQHSFFFHRFRDISISLLLILLIQPPLIIIFMNFLFYSNISFLFRLLETRTSACLRLTINRYVMERYFHFSWRNAFHSRFHRIWLLLPLCAYNPRIG